MGKNSAEFKKNECAQTVRIAKTAAKLFDERGYLETSIVDIASGVKLSKGGIFHYFPTKNEILCFVLSNYMDLVLEGLEEDLKNIEDAFSRLHFIISRHIELYIKNIHEAKVLLHESHNLPLKYFKIIAEKERKYFRNISGTISDIFDGSISKSKLTGVTFTLFGMLNWIYWWYDPKGSLTPKELSEIIYDIFSRGVSNCHATSKMVNSKLK